ncbi:ATP-dependent DNA helicase RecG [Dictyobacter kobayashii]|uniref:ATP-dependent DNA helicase RecG n=1 Tax=Dictyobacter kobayashii TaxID=2014872 RepID=A0A402AKR9_9CHLR|nr:ATP-dependent DNA helicase RecG [Dictyobacter kobayashii]GCE19625.1 ATP-dependent DNA helicase RecG [Dictyobacter kobayashii]
MSNRNTATLTTYVERARKVLQHEQRTNHQDQAIKPGGVEAFTARWYADTSALCQSTGQDASPLQRFASYLDGYHQQDPIQRASSLRAALAILNELEMATPDATAASQANSKPTSSPTASKPVRQPAPENIARRKSAAAAPEEARAATTKNAKPAATPKSAASKEPPQDIPNPIRLEAGMSQGHTSLTLLSADITAIPGVGPTVAARLHSLGLRTVRDLLFYFPREHRDYSQLTKIADVPFNEVTTTMGLIWDVETKRTGNGRTRTIATISDETGKLYVSWFNQPYLQKQLQASQGNYLVVTGVKQRFGNKVEFSVRSHELPEQGDLLNTGRMVPIYPLTEGLNAKALRRFTKYVVDRYAKMIPDYLPSSIQSAARLMMLSRAIEQIHYPDNEELRASAHHRLAFDELFMLQLGMQERRARWQREAKDGNAFMRYDHRIFLNPTQDTAKASKKAAPNPAAAPLLGSTLWSVIATDKPFEGTLPFSFTAAQSRVINEIFADLTKNKPMCRLLQGDVGAGKTAVAAASLLLAALNGYQGAIMAPTELLAEQHARSISAMLEPFGIQTVLLTGSQRQRERNLARQALESGQAAVAIGTHALIQDDVNFHSLGLVIVDEQHRFGVEQRDALRQKGLHPHMLVMTATPIPRTLALTLYGDLDVSVIDQLPPGRQKIITRWRTGTRRNEANTLIAQQVAEGRQAFIICPLIEESESLSAKAATSEYERLQREVFPNLRIGLLHGAMKPADKDQIMHRFRDHELDILVATSVIEVGIDIPNATVMVIEDADRFGLSQLHQFRGRVGRGKYQSYCYVLSAEASIQAQERLGVFQDTDDGFKLSEEDLRLRGPGDFIGVRQSGMPELHIADFSDTALIEQARSFAEQLWQSDPYLRKPEHTPLRERMHLFWQNFMAH